MTPIAAKNLYSFLFFGQLIDGRITYLDAVVETCMRIRVEVADIVVIIDDESTETALLT